MESEEVRRIYDSWFESAGKFDGDLALFWAGRLSTAAGMVINSKPIHLSDTCWLLGVARREYDQTIIDRTK